MSWQARPLVWLTKSGRTASLDMQGLQCAASYSRLSRRMPRLPFWGSADGRRSPRGGSPRNCIQIRALGGQGFSRGVIQRPAGDLRFEVRCKHSQLGLGLDAASLLMGPMRIPGYLTRGSGADRAHLAEEQGFAALSHGRAPQMRQKEKTPPGRDLRHFFRFFATVLQ